MAAPALWQPQEQGLREICTLLEAHISPNSDQARIWQQLQHYSQFPDFNNYLVFLLARGEVRPSFLPSFLPPRPSPANRSLDRPLASSDRCRQ
jgi:hypothetical protein